MKQVLVRCWEVYHYRSPTLEPTRLYITYPEDNSGHDLITCLRCGTVYAVTVAKEVYIGPPLVEKLRGLKCIKCNVSLEENFAYYPDTYIYNGNECSYERPTVIPPDETSIVVAFPEIYE